MTDVADRAQEREQVNLARALERRAETATVREQPFEIEGRRVCLDCFEPLSRKRLKANPAAVRCVECQELKEKQDRRKR
jgi:DnaK suppressor protein